MRAALQNQAYEYCGRGCGALATVYGPRAVRVFLLRDGTDFGSAYYANSRLDDSRSDLTIFHTRTQFSKPTEITRVPSGGETYVIVDTTLDEDPEFHHQSSKCEVVSPLLDIHQTDGVIIIVTHCQHTWIRWVETCNTMLSHQCCGLHSSRHCS